MLPGDTPPHAYTTFHYCTTSPPCPWQVSRLCGAAQVLADLRLRQEGHQRVVARWESKVGNVLERIMVVQAARAPYP